MKKLFAILTIIFFASLLPIKAQDRPAKPKTIITGKFIGLSKPLKDAPAMSKEEYMLMQAKAKKRGKNTPFDLPKYPYASKALPKGNDAAWQNLNGNKSLVSLAPIQNYEGQSSPYYPPDCNGTAGPNHYMQTVNSTYAIYSKTGTLLVGPTAMNTLFGNVTGANVNDGDPIILYDEQAARFVAVEFSVSGTNDYMLIAVSTSNDPTGTWYQYSFDVVDMPDYEKMAVWRDGYYMGTNTQPSTGSDIYVFERSQMLSGGIARMVAFDNPYRPGTGVVVVPPVDNDGPAAPVGTPGTFIAFNDDAVGGGADELWLYELAVDWTTPANSSFNRTQQIAVTPFDSQFSNGWDNLSQPGTSMKLCAISTVIMNVPQYRNFGTYQSIVCCHTVDVDNTDHAGVRWYELRKTPPSTTWTLRQQGTYAPDAHSRWMGSVAMNGSGKIAVGYSLSSSTEYPGIRYAGQSSAAYQNASGVLDVPEVTAVAGANFQYTYNRWGDYSSMSVDPSDDQTFWFTTEYIGTSEARKTKIISFKIGNNPVVTTLAASAISTTSATINGSVNPNGLATTYYFEWGTTTLYGNTTTSISAGAGSSNINVSENLSGLTPNQTYHFRLVAVNSDGTSNGIDLSFIAGGASLTTTAASSISLISAASGGNITSDGGSAITARGVCWSTSANPTISGSYTSNGSGTGVFSSAISGLLQNTTYHIRAYATNSSGTYYGNDVQFTTLCGVYTLPFTESFNNSTLPNCWSQIDNQGGGQIWQFGTITGQAPNPLLSGNYAYLNSDAYGSGFSQNADLITPTLDLSGYTNITLAFNHYFKSYAGSSGALYYSINNGSTWTSLASFTATSATNPIAFSQLITSVAGQSQVKFKWNYTGAWGYYWGIDDISITSACTLPLAAGTITGPATACQSATAVAYSIPTITNATTYTWAYSGSGATITGTSNNITISFDANATSGNLNVKGHNACGDGIISANYAITINPLPVAAGTISGAASVCQGATSVAYSVGAISNATSYVWSYSGTGATISGSGNNISITFASNATLGNLSVIGHNTCGDGVASVLPISINYLPASAAGAIAGNNTVCQGQSIVAYAVPAITYATTYVWTLPNGASGASATDSIIVNYGYAATSGNISVKGHNACGDGAISNLAIVVNAMPSAPLAGTITQPTCSSATASLVLNGLPASGSWMLVRSPGGIITNGTGTSASITGLASGTYTYTVTNALGCISLASSNIIINIQPSPPIAPSGSAAQSFCSAIMPRVANLTASGAGIQWYSASSGGSALASTTALSNGSHYFASQTISGCESTARLDVAATINPTPSAPSGDAAQSFCYAATVANLVASGTNINWYDAANGGNLLLSNTPLINGNTYYASQSLNACESQSRLGVAVTINPTVAINAVTQAVSGINLNGATFNAELTSTCPNPTIARGFVYANHANPSLSNALSTVLNAGNGVGTYSSVLTTLSSNTDYWVRAFAINATDTAYGAILTFKTGIWPFFNLELKNDIQTNDRTYEFDIILTHTGNYVNPVQFELSTIQMGIYFNSAILNGGTATATVVPGSTSDFNVIQQQTNANLYIIGPTTGNKTIKITAKTASSGFGTLISTSTGSRVMRVRLTNTVAFAQLKPNLNYSFTATGPSWQTIVNAYIATISKNISANGTFIVNGLLNPTLNLQNSYTLSGGGAYCAGSGTPVSISLDGSQSAFSYQLKKDGINYGSALVGTGNPLTWNTTDAGTYTCVCDTLNMNGSAIVTINSTPTPTADANQSFNYTPTIADLTAMGTTIKWYDAATGGNLLASSYTMLNGNTYYASQTIAGCESQSRVAVAVAISLYKIINLHLFLEGLFDNNTLIMHEAMDGNTGQPYYGDGIADKIQVDLYNENTPFAPAGVSVSGIDLATNGLASFQISTSLNGNYYVKVSNRNHLTYWSAIAIPFNTSTVNYYFTTDMLQAYGSDPQVQVSPGIFAFFVGDLDQGGWVDANDFNIFEYDLIMGTVGFLPSDLDGSGWVDSDDYNVLEPRLMFGVFTEYPGLY